MVSSSVAVAPAIALQTGVLNTGKTGSGKSSTAKGLIETAVVDPSLGFPHVLPGARACIIDPIKSDWWGITLDADGVSPGLPFVILGGPHGHVPLSDTAGAAIGELVASAQLPLCIIDMAFFKMGGLQRFWCDFAEVIFRKNRGPLPLLLEEAHELAPKERSGIGSENMAVYWSKKIATAGRSKGIRPIVSTQRTQSLHNAVMSSCETLLAHRMSFPDDIEPVINWVRASIGKVEAKAIEAVMSQLKNGEAFICNEGTVTRHQFPLMKSFDNTKTPDGTEVHASPPPIDRSALLRIVGDAVKEAEENDVETLKARIKELEQGGNPESDASREEVSNARVAGYEAAKKDSHLLMQRFMSQCREVLGDVDNASRELKRLFGPGASDVSPAAGNDRCDTIPSERVRPALVAVSRQADAVEPALPHKVRALPAGGVGTGARQLIDAAVKFTPRDFIGFEWNQLRLLAGLRAGGHFNTARKQAIESGLLVEENGLVRPRASERDPNAKMPTRKDVGVIWERKLTGLERDILVHALNMRHGTTIRTSDLQKDLGKLPGGHWNSNIASVRDAGLVESRGGTFGPSSFVGSLR